MKFQHTLSLAILVAVGCATRSAPPLPGDSVSSDGAVTLSPPKFSTAPSEAPLGAIESKLFPPELVMENQGALAVTSEQRDAILKEVDRGQTEILHLQWQLQGEKEKLVSVLDADKVDETKAKDQAAHVMDFENRVKSAHLMMLVRVKNLLTPAQQKTLRELRARPQSTKDGG
jgi:Spy/CpxP family protein refolding chaperone